MLPTPDTQNLLGEPYKFEVPAMDTRYNPWLQPVGTFSRLVGVDGRYAGRLRRHPGYKLPSWGDVPDSVDDSLRPWIGSGFPANTYAGEGSAQSVAWGGSGGVELMEFFCIQLSPGSTSKMRGLVFLGRRTSGGTEDGLYIHYSIDGAAPVTERILAFRRDSTPYAVEYIDLTFDHNQLIVVGKADDTFFAGLRYDASGWYNYSLDPGELKFTAVQDGPGGNPNEIGLFNWVTVPVTTLPGVFAASDRVSFAFRFVCPEQDYYGALSTVVDVQPTVLNAKDCIKVAAYVDNTVTDIFPVWASKVYVEVYRSVASSYSDSEAYGNLYLESRIPFQLSGSTPVLIYFYVGGRLPPLGIDVQTDNPNFSQGYYNGLYDGALAQGTLLDPLESLVHQDNPPTRKIQEYERLWVMLSSASSANPEASQADTLRWSPLIQDRPNLIPLHHRRRPPDLSDVAVQLVKAGGYLAALHENSITRLFRSGTRLSVDVIHNRYGAPGENSAVAVGSHLYFITPVGVLVADMATSQMDVAGATQHICDVTSEWKDTLDEVWGAHDSDSGALVLFNASKGESLVIWMNEGVLTMMEGEPWDRVLDGADLVEGGVRRALYVLAADDIPGSVVKVYVANSARDGDTYTTNGGAENKAYNGVQYGAGAALDTITIEGGGLEFDSEMVGHFVEVLSGDNEGERRRITGQTVTTLTLDDDLPELMGDGDRVAVAGVPFEARLWPVTGGPEGPGVPDLFHYKKVTSVGLVSRELDGETGATNQNRVFDVEMYVGDLETASASGQATVALVPQYVGAAVNGAGIIPIIRQRASNLDFSLQAVWVQGTVDRSRRVSAAHS